MPLYMPENMLGTLVKASRILVYDLPLPYEECLFWIYCPEITPGSSCKKFLKKWMQESRNAELHPKFPTSVPNYLPDTLFWHTFSQVFLYNLSLRSCSSAGILSWEQSFYSSFLLCSPPSDSGQIESLFSILLCLLWTVSFLHPQKYFLLIYSWDSPDCVSNHWSLLMHKQIFYIGFCCHGNFAAFLLLFIFKFF